MATEPKFSAELMRCIRSELVSSKSNSERLSELTMERWRTHNEQGRAELFVPRQLTAIVNPAIGQMRRIELASTKPACPVELMRDIEAIVAESLVRSCPSPHQQRSLMLYHTLTPMLIKLYEYKIPHDFHETVSKSYFLIGNADTM